VHRAVGATVPTRLPVLPQGGRGHTAGDTDAPPELCSPPDEFSEKGAQAGTSERGARAGTNLLVNSAKVSLPNVGRQYNNMETEAPTLGGTHSRTPDHTFPLHTEQRLQPKERVRFLHIPRHSLKDFKRFARDAAVEAQCQLAVDNPYVQALVNHRAEMQSFAIAPTTMVPSVEQMLGTQRDNLSMLSHTKTIGDDVMQLARTMTDTGVGPIDESCEVLPCCSGVDSLRVGWGGSRIEPVSREHLYKDPPVVLCSIPCIPADSSGRTRPVRSTTKEQVI